MSDPEPRPTRPEPVRALRSSERRAAGWFRRLYLTLRTEHMTPGKLASAVGIGVFVGCSPFWGIHFGVAVFLAYLLRLNRVVVYAAANLANPLTAPFIVFCEIQVGHRLLHGAWLGLSFSELRAAGVTGLFASLLLGSVVVGVTLGLALALTTYLLARGGDLPGPFQEIADDVVRRYLDVSIRDAEASRARLLRDPIYRTLLDDPVWNRATRVLDLGCGRGLVAAVVEAAGQNPPNRSYLGVEISNRYVRVAREAIGDLPGHRVIAGNLRDFDPPPADLVLLLDTLRYLPPASQDALLRRLGKALAPGAVLLVREHDAAGGWAFRWLALMDVVRGLIPGRPHYRFGYRRASDLRNALVAAGFEVRDRTTGRLASRGRVLLEAVRRPVAVSR